MRRTLVIMVKEPRPGRVKTRLGRDIGMTTAAWWYRHQVTRLLHRVRDPRWQIVLAVAPDLARMAPIWPADMPRIPQGRGDLGARMRRGLTAGLPGHVCLIGSDIPDITPAHIWRAFQSLGQHDTVFGPATDGGFWLVGLRRTAPPTLFQDVRWSSPHALTDTLASLAGETYALVDTLSDIDDVADLSL